MKKSKLIIATVIFAVFTLIMAKLLGSYPEKQTIIVTVYLTTIAVGVSGIAVSNIYINSECAAKQSFLF